MHCEHVGVSAQSGLCLSDLHHIKRDSSVSMLRDVGSGRSCIAWEVLGNNALERRKLGSVIASCFVQSGEI